MPAEPPSTATARRLADPKADPSPGVTRITTDPIDLSAARAELDDATGGTGAVVTFTGVVRADQAPDGTAEGPVERLEFESFPEMAEEELRRIRGEAIARFGLRGLTIHHRTGRLRVGEDIVLVAAAAAHRKEAFAAAAWTMDEVKRRVPVWKREVRKGGTTRWVSGDDCSCGADAGPTSDMKRNR